MLSPNRGKDFSVKDMKLAPSFPPSSLCSVDAFPSVPSPAPIPNWCLSSSQGLRRPCLERHQIKGSRTTQPGIQHFFSLGCVLSCKAGVAVLCRKGYDNFHINLLVLKNTAFSDSVFFPLFV